ncbi:MAG: hypothetical protein KF685_00880 [Acidobacteria bacterium]|nr:hypothetical protein [Acidobacteriota bacterium]
MNRSLLKRFLGAFVGLIYAVLYGFWTMLNTGGGHGNFLWFILFVITSFFGTFFPIIGFLIVDMRSFLTKIIAGCLLAVHVALNIFLLSNMWFYDEGMRQDILDSWKRSPEGFVVASVLYVLPLFTLSALYLWNLFRQIEDETPISLIKDI